MTPQEMITQYFATHTPEEVYADLVECGLYEIKSWEECGIELYSSEDNIELV